MEKMMKMLDDARNCIPNAEDSRLIDFLIVHTDREIDEGSLITTAFLVGKLAAGGSVDLG